MKLKKQNINRIKDLCIKHKVKELRLSESVSENSFNNSNNLTFKVEFEGVDLACYLSNFLDLKEHLESLFLQHIDLIDSQATADTKLNNYDGRDTFLIYERINSEALYDIIIAKNGDNKKPY